MRLGNPTINIVMARELVGEKWINGGFVGELLQISNAM